MLYINAHVWNLEKWYTRTYVKDRNRNADVEKGHVDTVGEGEGGKNWESSVGIHTLQCVAYTTMCKVTGEWDPAV